MSIPATLADEVCAALGVPLPSDTSGVDALYRAWSVHVPFDPVAKAVAVRQGARPPGDDPLEVAERWLTTGLGSTCWGHCTLLSAVLAHAGVRSAVSVERMRRDDDVVDFHSFLVAELDGVPHLIDPVHVSGAPLRLADGATCDHPLYLTRMTTDAPTGRLIHQVEHPPYDACEYVIVATDLDADDVRSFLRVSATHSGVGRRFFLRRVLSDRVVSFHPADDGGGLVEKTTFVGLDPIVRTLDDPDEALTAAGLAPSARAQIESAGLLTAADGGGLRWAT